MNYDEILRYLANKNNVTIKEVENEMKEEISLAGLNCSVKEFIETTSILLKEKTIYSIIV
ncbi:MAG: hypothetical protein IJW78_04585 [Clostridia bacterium]|nr:hypothetical protein [Clostridia bacterium]